jgi:hypothetical protein
MAISNDFNPYPKKMFLPFSVEIKASIDFAHHQTDQYLKPFNSISHNS